jgi:hypothetical protein
MTINKVLTPVAFAALLSLAAAPALAQRRGDGGRSASRSRGSVARSSSGYRGGVVVRGGGVRGVYVRPRASFYRPYYSFRPRVSIGLGLWMGYPVPYPYYYERPYSAYPYPDDPYAYGSVAPAYPSSNYPSSNYPSSNYPSSPYPAYGSSSQGYPAQGPAPSVGVQRGQQSATGGISFEITPENAEVFVDGRFMGTAGEFGPNAEPLGVASGRRRIEVRASGYRTMTFDADVQSGQVIPFQGTLQRN